MNKFESKYFNTGKKIDDALIELLNKKEFEDISISDICKKAHVNRSTFYLHYDNIYDVLEEVIDNLNKSFQSYFASHLKIDFANKEKLYLIKDEYLFPYLDFIKANKKVYMAINDNYLLFKANETYNKLSKDVFFPILHCFNNDDKYHKYIITFFLHGLSSLILTWCKDDFKLSNEEMVKLIKELIPKNEN